VYIFAFLLVRDWFVRVRMLPLLEDVGDVPVSRAREVQV
jgi:hypothetical protein